MDENSTAGMPASESGPELVYEFGAYRLDATEGLLRKSGCEVQLSPTLLEILLTLIENPGRTLGKQQFMERVWPGRVVEDGNLARNISTLRKLLDDDAHDPRYIETVPRRGYRFIAAVETRPAESPSARVSESPDRTLRRTPANTSLVDPLDWARRIPRRVLLAALPLAGALAVAALLVASRTYSDAELAAPRIQSLVVLPMEDLSGDPSEAYFADGMTEVLISYLHRIAALQVTSRTSAMHYKNRSERLSEIANELGVQAVVESSFLRSGSRVRITVRLVEAASDSILLNKTFEEDLEDVLSLQSEIARTIAESVRAAVSPEESRRLASVKQVNQEAYETYLLGLAFKNKLTVPSLQEAIEYFEEAISMEPGLAQAYAAEADAYLRLASWQGPSAELWPKAMEAADKALAIDEDVPEAQLVLAGWLLCHELDQQQAERAFLHALELHPGDSTTHLRHAYSLMTQGRFEESLAEARESLHSDPASLEKNMVLGGILYHAGEYDEALQQLQFTLELAPDYASTQRAIGLVLLQKGKQDEAIAALERALALHAGQGIRGDLGYAYAVSGRRRAALRQLEKLEDLSRAGHDSAFSIALVHHGLGETDEAIDWLNEAYEERDFRMIRLLVDPVWDDVRDEPRFRQLLLTIGLGRPRQS